VPQGDACFSGGRRNTLKGLSCLSFLNPDKEMNDIMFPRQVGNSISATVSLKGFRAWQARPTKDFLPPLPGSRFLNPARSPRTSISGVKVASRPHFCHRRGRSITVEAVVAAAAPVCPVFGKPSSSSSIIQQRPFALLLQPSLLVSFGVHFAARNETTETPALVR
jgi:hypothetical protein